jgi:hypothetical protein
MITLATAEVAGIAFFLVPVPVAAAIVILGARNERADTFLLLMVAVTLLPAVWATATRAGWGGCDGCLSDREEDLMTAALASVPFLAAAIVLLFTERGFAAERAEHQRRERSPAWHPGSDQRRVAPEKQLTRAHLDVLDADDTRRS